MNKTWDILLPKVSGYSEETLMEEAMDILYKQFFLREEWADFTQHFPDKKSYKYRVSVEINPIKRKNK